MEVRPEPVYRRLDPNIKDAIYKLAHRDRRTIRAYIEILLMRHIEELRQKGELDDDDTPQTRP